jgi:hypothetical protein
MKTFGQIDIVVVNAGVELLDRLTNNLKTQASLLVHAPGINPA